MTYAGRTKYDEPGRAARYAERSVRRHAEEWALIERTLAGRAPPATVLDVPCGTGRIAAERLARGARVRCADLSPAMRAAAAASLAGKEGFLGVEPLDLEAPGGAPDAWAADLVVCFRFLHHLPDAAARGRVAATLARLARPAVLVSFHHPVSAHHLARAVRRLLTGRKGDRHAVTVRTLRREAAEHGLRLVRAEALSRWRRDLWTALLERT